MLYDVKNNKVIRERNGLRTNTIIQRRYNTMAKMPMEKLQDKIPIKKITQSLGNVAIGGSGYSARQSIDAKTGYTLLCVGLYNFGQSPIRRTEDISLLQYRTKLV